MSLSSKAAKTTNGSGLLMILSPAKTLNLDLTQVRLKEEWTHPNCDSSRSSKVAETLKSKSKTELQKLLGISANLAETAHEYWSNYALTQPKKKYLGKASIFSFSGAAYQGLDVDTCSDEALTYMQSNLRIIDPLYGTLRALDVMQPYRLEMATKQLFKDTPKLKLADYWKDAVTKSLNDDLKGRPEKYILNLASDEYSAAVDSDLLDDDVVMIKVVFWQEGRTIAVHAKRARGLMVRYLAEHNVTSLEEVKKFDEEGYEYKKKASDDHTLVFDRKKPPAAKKKAAPKLSEPITKKRRKS